MKTAIIQPSLKSDYSIQLERISQSLGKNKIVLSSDDLSVDRLKGEGVRVVVASDLSKETCYLLRGLGVVTILFGDRAVYRELADIVVDYKCLDSDHYFTGPSVDFSTQPPGSFVEVIDLVKKLEWDSDFFGVNVAYVSCLHLSDNIYKEIERFSSENNIQLIEYLCNCHDRRSVKIAEKEGFSFVDIRLTFSKKIKEPKAVVINDGLIFKKAVEKDIPSLEAMAGQIYTKSRYFFDSQFGPEKAKSFYEGWIAKAVRGQFDDECWCLFDGDDVVAFCSIRYEENNVAQIGLCGVHEKQCGKGLGKQVLGCVIEQLAVKGISELTVVTQGRNYAAQNLYQSVGFKTKETQLWYHKWR